MQSLESVESRRERPLRSGDGIVFFSPGSFLFRYSYPRQASAALAKVK